MAAPLVANQSVATNGTPAEGVRSTVISIGPGPAPPQIIDALS
jgi:hypothetical protein